MVDLEGLSEDQKKHAEEISKITEEEVQYVVDNFKEFEGLTEPQVQSKIVLKVRKRVQEELGLELGF